MENWIEITAIILSSLALLISGVTLWLTLLRKGKVCMTQPTQIFFGPDGGSVKSPKIFLLTLLYATSKKGRVIEDMFVRLKLGEMQQNFNIWVYDDRKASKLVRGSGLFVGETGIATSHNFLLPKQSEQFDFKAGSYTLEIYVKLVGEPKTTLLNKTELSISESEAKQLQDSDKGIFFDWGPDSNKYITHIDDRRPPRNNDVDFFSQEVLSGKKAS